jgi:hypothetical protein
VNICVFDFETYLSAPGRRAPKPVLLAWQDGLGVETQAFEATRGLPLLRDRVLRNDILFVGHNVAFDFAVLCQAMPDLIPHVFAHYSEGRVFDTMDAETLLNIAAGKTGALSLAGLAKKYLGVEVTGKKDADAWRFRYQELDGLPVEQYPPEAVSYAKSDVSLTARVFQHQLAHCQQQFGGLPPLTPETFRSSWTFTVMESWGLRVDPWLLDGLQDRVVNAVDRSTKELISAGLFDIDGKEITSETKLRIVQERGDYEPPADGATQDADPYAALAQSAELVDEARGEVVEALWKDLERWAKSQSRENEVRFVLAHLKSPEKVTLTDKNSIKMDKAVLEAALDPVLKVRARAKEVEKIHSTYLPLLGVGRQYPINPRWNTTVNSFRSSCRQPNAQNLAKFPGVRECFVPHLPGWVFVGADYATAELRSLAQVCLKLFGFSALGDTINAGKDPHLVFAASLLGEGYEAIVQKHKAGDSLVKDLRNLGKAVNFGLPGGLGAEKFLAFARAQYHIELAKYAPPEYWPGGAYAFDSASAATIKSVGLRFFKERIKPAWLMAYPEIKELFRYMGDLTKTPFHMLDDLDEDGEAPAKPKMHTISYRHPITEFVRGGVYFTSGCNHNFQHLTAVGAKAALDQVVYEAYVDKTSALYGCRVPVFVHDEIIIEAPYPQLHEAGERLSQVMMEQMNRYTPDYPADVDSAAMRRWRKGAERVLDGQGRLIPWEDRPTLSEKEWSKLDSCKDMWDVVIKVGLEPDRAAKLWRAQGKGLG